MDNKKWFQTFLFIWSGQFISILTSNAVYFAIIIWLSLEQRSAEVLAYAGIAGMIPQAIIGPFAGIFIDRWDRKKVMIISDTFLALCALIMAYLLQSEAPNLYLIYLMLGLRSIANAFHAPALQAVTPLIVPENELLRVSGINQIIHSTSSIAGPIVGTLAITYLPVSNVLYLDVIGAIIAIISLLPITIPHVTTATKASVKAIIKELISGCNEVLKNRGLSYLFLYTTAITFFIMPVAIMFPLLTIEHYNGEKWEISIIEIVWGVGMLIGGTLLGTFKVKVSKIILVNTMHLLLGLSYLLCGWLPSMWFIGFALATALGGIALSIFSASFNTILQIEVAPDKLGRVFSLYFSLAVLPSATGMLFTGMIAETIGVTNAFLICGCIVITIGILSFLTPSLMRLGTNKEAQVENKPIV
ncbi:MAG TPA: MFS transporter [Cytophagaceae bacterium]